MMPSAPRATRLPVPIISSQGRRAWPKHPGARPVHYQTLTTALTTRYPYDAHLAGYSKPAWPYRLSSGALLSEASGQLPDGVAMVLAAFDIDCPMSHRGSGGSGEIASEAWWDAERRKVEALAQAHPKPFAPRSRGGYRLLSLLPEPYILSEPADREAWSTRYLTWCAYLLRRYDIHADLACKDWTRLYRLPHATRTPGGPPEEWPTWGDPRDIGVWAYTPTAEDMTLAQSLNKRTPRTFQARQRPAPWASAGTGEGVLYHTFRARGWLGDPIEAGKKWAVACPWEAQHTKGARYDTSTVIFAPGDGDSVGWWYCSHSHCTGRDLRDVLALFSESELTRAREAAGLITRTAHGLRLSHTRGHLRTIPAKEVLAWQR